MPSTVTSAQALLFLHAQTPMHPGAGIALGVVDLPVQRERHTQWPTIPGSTLKGVLRAECQRNKGEHVSLIFGPETANASEHGGCLSLTDARILAFPVRSLRGGFAWVSCYEVLERLSRDIKLSNRNAEAPKLPEQVVAARLLCDKQSPLLLGNNRKVILEEFDFDSQDSEKLVSWAKWIAERALEGEALQKMFVSRFVILHQDDFTHFVRFATEVVARIGLDKETKTVKPGALFYEEFLPAETVFYSVLLAGETRKKAKDDAQHPAKAVKLSASQVLTWLKERSPEVLQIGGDETIGKGFCLPKLHLDAN